MQLNQIQKPAFENIDGNTRWLKRTVPNTTLYFAYGSNINQDQMAVRCPGAQPVAIAKCPRYKFIINGNGVATILPEKDTDAFGILWNITDAHERALDRYEGVKFNIYTKETINVWVEGEKVMAMVYLATLKDVGPPRAGYLEGILEGIETFNGHKQWINDVETWQN